MHGSYHIPQQVLFVKLNYASASHVKILLKTLLGNEAKFCITLLNWLIRKKIRAAQSPSAAASQFLLTEHLLHTRHLNMC